MIPLHFFFLQSLFTSMFHCRLAVLHAKNFFLQVLVRPRSDDNTVCVYQHVTRALENELNDGISSFKNKLILHVYLMIKQYG
jgi:hypothetical protein